MLISIVIPNFNSASLLEKNLPILLFLLKKSKLDYEVIISDDASTDDSLKVAEQFALKTVTSDKNTGFAGNVDRGIRKAKGEVVFTIKTDGLPKTSTYFVNILKHFDNPRVFAVSAALHTVEDGKKEVRGQGVLIFHRGFYQHFRTFEDYKNWLLTMRSTKNMVVESEKIPSGFSAWSDGGASAFRKDLYLKIGGFDPIYNPFYWEDTDLGFRAWKAGYEIHFEPTAIMEHKHEAGAIRRHYNERAVNLISLRNKFIFTWKNADLRHLWSYFLWEPFHELVAIKTGNWLFFLAYFQAFWKWPEIIYKRIRQKKVLKLTDDEVLAKLI